MVMTEAMACRTPVITRPNGSVPEVVDDGKTGSIVGSVEEMAAAIDRLGALEPGTLPASSTATATQHSPDRKSPAAPPLHHCAVAAVGTNRGRVRAVSRLSAAGRRLRSNGRDRADSPPG
jgi:glycosyltransferase involved in cell wall biosynthesis